MFLKYVKMMRKKNQQQQAREWEKDNLMCHKDISASMWKLSWEWVKVVVCP